MQKPLITLTLAYVAGLLLGKCFLYAPAAVSALIVLSLLIAGLCSWSGLLSFRWFLLLAVPCALGMALYLSASSWLPSDHYRQNFPETTVKHE
jgi:hypothetical protein